MEEIANNRSGLELKQTNLIVLESVWSKGHDGISLWNIKEDDIIPIESGRIKNIHSMTLYNGCYDF